MSSAPSYCAARGQQSCTTRTRGHPPVSNSGVVGGNNGAMDDGEESSAASSSSSSHNNALPPSNTRPGRPYLKRRPSSSSLSSLTLTSSSSHDADVAYARATVEEIIRTGRPVSVDLGNTTDDGVWSDDSDITVEDAEEESSSSTSPAGPTSSSAATPPLVYSSALTEPTVGTTSTSATESTSTSRTSRPSGLYWRVFPGSYNRAIKRCRTHPREARFCLPLPSASQPEVYGLSPLHHVCHRSDHPPPALARALLDAWPESSELTDHYGYTPLHRAVGSDGMGMDAYRVVLGGGMERDLMGNPGFVVGGQNFLQRFCDLYAVDMAEALRGIGFDTCHCRQGGGGGRDGGGVPLRGIAGGEAASPEPPPPRERAMVAGGTQHRIHHRDQQGQHHGHHSLFLDKVALLVSAYCHRSIPRTDDSSASQYLPSPPSVDRHRRRRHRHGHQPPRKFRMVHACLATPDCPTPLLELAFSLHPHQVRERDGDGNYPLHVAASNPSLKNRSPAISGRLFGFLLARFPAAASSGNRCGRLPLNLAIEAGQGWDDCLAPLLGAAPDALETRDPVRNLYPFMIAAVSRDDGPTAGHEDLDRLDVVYRLLRACPEMDRLSSVRRRRDGGTGGCDRKVGGDNEGPSIDGTQGTVSATSASPPVDASPSPRPSAPRATTTHPRGSQGKRKRREAQGVCVDGGESVAHHPKRRRDQEGGGRDDDTRPWPTPGRITRSVARASPSGAGVSRTGRDDEGGDSE